MKRHSCNDALLTIQNAKRHTCNDSSQNPRSFVNNSKWHLKREVAREEASRVNIRQGLARKPQTTSSVPRFSCSHRSFYLKFRQQQQPANILCLLCVFTFIHTHNTKIPQSLSCCCGDSSKVSQGKNLSQLKAKANAYLKTKQKSKR